MQYRQWGQTQQTLSVFSLGTMRYLDDSVAALAVIKTALDFGVNHIETAQAYGDSELILAQALKISINRQDVYLTTKLLPVPHAVQFAASLDRSFQRLGVDYIDNLAIHGINTSEHLAWALEFCLPVLEIAQRAGKIGAIGFSTHGSLELICQAIETRKFAFVNLHYNYFFQRNAAAIQLAQQRHMGVFMISPADKGGLLYQPSPQLIELCHPFHPLHLNYRFLLSQPAITTLSFGPARPDEVPFPLEVADQTTPLTDLEQEIFQRIEDHLQTTLGLEHCHQCYACLPCPEEIAIPEILRLRNLTVGLGMQDYGAYRYQMLEKAGHWFPGRPGARCTDCGDCLPRCPSQLNIPALLRDTHAQLRGPGRRRLWQTD
ncbi:aldo/keto reductase [Synechococcus sp. PCC 6312]|uniref:aldo/keto reductase n=1 Tax=Synechococcus sp. (strain ATCC 27167 / PCC 6312) TaxID=195253 RepID=UPI00029F2095|nr:aldo/keto reductase [Synechococcus sp. PCC 6312]AFY59524.1 putative oxidoreductase of aldo/keto reductase family [Synechococcus sp. PCC 6312]